MAMDDFLKKTYFCDIDHPEIRRFAELITKGSGSDNERAIKLFYWVRDNIPYTFGKWEKRASEVLLQRKGMCTNKALLLCTLLRSLGIPAAFGILKVKGQEYFGPISISMLTRRVKKVSVHWYCCVYCDNKWIKVDPSPDKMLSEKTSYFNPTTEMVDWDGHSDAMENIHADHILEEFGPLANVDDKLRKKPRKITVILIRMGNLYLEFLRNHLGDVKDVKELEAQFIFWLKKRHPFYYYFFVLSSATGK